MKPSKTLKMTIKIILLFLIPFAFSFIAENFRWLMGDWFCNGRYSDWSEHENCTYDTLIHMPTWHWGFRHFVIIAMGLTLFIVGVVRLIGKDTE